MNYKSLKKIAFSVLPKRFLLRFEPSLRSLFLFRFRGSKYLCNICDSPLKKFIPLDDQDLLCPFCGSRSRTRALFKILDESKLLTGTVLHFSPSRSLYRNLKKNPKITYISTDFANEFIADHHFDITNITLDEGSVDLIICFHILEHIIEDQKAINELARVLDHNGICLVQTPFKTGGIYEDNTIINPQERLKVFGQEDHVRIYSINGLQKRLLQNGFVSAEILNLNDRHLGIPNQRILWCKKNK